MRESKVEKYLVDQIEAHSGYIRKIKWIGRRGAPDRLVIINGLTVFVELKAPGEKLDGHQCREISKMRKAGALVYVFDSYNDIDKKIKDWLSE